MLSSMNQQYWKKCTSYKRKKLSAVELHPLKHLSQNMHTAFLAQPFLASVLFVTAKCFQTKCAASLSSGSSRFALLKREKKTSQLLTAGFQHRIFDGLPICTLPSAYCTIHISYITVNFANLKATQQYIWQLAPHALREVLGDLRLESLGDLANPGDYSYCFTAWEWTNQCWLSPDFPPELWKIPP